MHATKLHTSHIYLQKATQTHTHTSQRKSQAGPWRCLVFQQPPPAMKPPNWQSPHAHWMNLREAEKQRGTNDLLEHI
eukprot:1153874-Pelagomonas_calceolata.AAC.3